MLGHEQIDQQIGQHRAHEVVPVHLCRDEIRSREIQRPFGTLSEFFPFFLVFGVQFDHFLGLGVGFADFVQDTLHLMGLLLHFQLIFGCDMEVKHHVQKPVKELIPY